MKTNIGPAITTLLVAGYAVIGLLALTVSFFFSFTTSTSILGNTGAQLATVVIMVAAFEAAKVACPIAQRALVAGGGSHNALAFTIPYILHPALVLLSGFSTVFLITSITALPNAESVRNTDLTSANTIFNHEAKLLEDEYKQRISGIERVTESALKKSESLHVNNITHLGSLIDEETDNEINGVFIGKRYRSFERRRGLAIKQYDEERMNIHESHAQKVQQATNDYSQKRDALRNVLADRARSIHNESYASDPRAQHTALYRFSQSVDSILDITLMPVGVAWVFAISVAAIIELIIAVIGHHFAGMSATHINKWKTPSVKKRDVEHLRDSLEWVKEINKLKEKILMEEMKTALFEENNGNLRPN